MSNFKRVGLFAIALGIVLQTATALADDCVVPTSGTTVTLRAAPSASSGARGTLGPGQSLPLVASVPRWYEIRLSSGKTAYALKQSTDIASCPGVVLTPATAPVTAPAGAGVFELHAIDVGTGLSVLVRGPDFNLLYDAGSNDDLALGDSNRTIAYLKTLQPPVQSLNHVILSHPHRDHVELLPDVVTRFKPRDVWNSGAFNNICGYRNFLLAIAADPAVQYHTATNDAGTESVDFTSAKCYGDQQPAQTVKIKHSKRITSDKIDLGQGASMTFLYIDGSDYPNAYNKNSLVMRLDLGSRRVLFMGDAEAGGRASPDAIPSSGSIEGKLLACCAPELKADVLIVGHHGSKSSSRAKFLAAVGAKTFIVSGGPTKYQSVVLPDAEIVTELGKLGKVLRTDLDDDACAASPAKVGPDDDGKAGGCDNVLVKFPASGPISADYRRVTD